MKSLIVVTLIVTLSECKIPSNFKQCYKKKTDFNTCVFNAVQDALPQLTKPYKEFNLPSLEPLEVKSLTVESARGALNINQKFKNCEFFGLTKAKFQKYEINFEKQTGEVIAVTPELKVNCEYELDGKVLLLPVKGEGNSTFIFKNFNTTYHSEYESYVKRNKTYIRFMKVDLQSDPEEVYIHFDNLFNGNRELGDNINKVLNENSKEIYQEIKPEYNELMSKVIKTLTNQVFGKVPLEELFGLSDLRK